MTKFEVILWSGTLIFIWTLSALVNFTGWPFSHHAAAVSTNRAIITTIFMGGLFTFLVVLLVWTDHKQRKQVAACAHKRTRTVCTDCGTTVR